MEVISKITQDILDINKHKEYEEVYSSAVNNHKHLIQLPEEFEQTRIQLVIDAQEQLGLDDDAYIVMSGVYNPKKDLIEFEGVYEGVEWYRTDLSEDELTNLNHKEFYLALIEGHYAKIEEYEAKKSAGEIVNLPKNELHDLIRQLSEDDLLTDRGLYTEGAVQVLTNHQIHNSKGDYLHTVGVSAHFRWDEDAQTPVYEGWSVLPPNNLVTIYDID